jgi:hypothetical protein
MRRNKTDKKKYQNIEHTKYKAKHTKQENKHKTSNKKYNKEQNT